MGVPYAAQLADKQGTVAQVLAGQVSPRAWLDAVPSAESHFRNKAKLVVGGTKGAPTLGILDEGGQGVDLRHCGLHEEPLHRAILRTAELLAASGLTPYDVSRRQGELKHLLMTLSPAGELMVRLVLRSPGQLRRVAELVGPLRQAIPGVRVVSVNLQPEHKAVLEGEEEVVLTEERTLPMDLGRVTLHLGTRSFFQTNTAVATALYAQAAAWVGAVGARGLLDLYCGVGGFALHCAGQDREVLGVEVSEEAVASARVSAAELGVEDRVRFAAGDATAVLGGAAYPDLAFDTVVVNPPRRGIGARLARALDGSDAETVIYSSCNAASLAADLAAMPTWRVEQARLFDMFPQTRHQEVAVLLRRA